ncbi:hypothetical protein EYC80_007517 [Monilinia laxa]|uniref:Uncharacterized protein n=1 Tax=Monilinia laxa TaxID=61186 RepID=A0A5N6JW51_MONLA|nr:hypothetical protein EYC80_007517 [Monilinia laxa]
MKLGKFKGSGCMNAGMIICIGTDWIGCGRAELGKYLLHFFPPGVWVGSIRKSYAFMVWAWIGEDWNINNVAHDVLEEHLSGMGFTCHSSQLYYPFISSERRDMPISVEKPSVKPKKGKKKKKKITTSQFISIPFNHVILHRPHSCMPFQNPSICMP